MSDKPAESAVERYEQVTSDWDRTANRRTLNALPSAVFRVMDAADDALAELKAEIAVTIKKMRGIEAEVERLKCCGNCAEFDIHHDPCGECEQGCGALVPLVEAGGDEFMHDWPQHGGKWGWSEPHDRCHWKLSRWTERGRE